VRDRYAPIAQGPFQVIEAPHDGVTGTSPCLGCLERFLRRRLSAWRGLQFDPSRLPARQREMEIGDTRLHPHRFQLSPCPLVTPLAIRDVPPAQAGAKL